MGLEIMIDDDKLFENTGRSPCTLIVISFVNSLPNESVVAYIRVNFPILVKYSFPPTSIMASSTTLYPVAVDSRTSVLDTGRLNISELNPTSVAVTIVVNSTDGG